jgi:hypothetical protein
VWNVQVYTQGTGRLCWEACARMMWHWKYKRLDVKAYAAKAGDFLRTKTGLVETEMDRFYRQLGLRSLARPGGSNLRHALKFGPAILTLIDHESGHALVAEGTKDHSYEVVNPCMLESIDFESEGDSGTVCQGGRGKMPTRLVDSQLGAYIWYW